MKDFLKRGTMVVTHTHTLAIILLFMIVGWDARGQNQGSFEISPTAPYTDPITGITECVVNWIGNANQGSIQFLSINMAVDGAAVCLNDFLHPSAPSIVNPAFLTGYTISLVGASISITRGSLNQSFDLSTPRPYTPLAILRFRSAPGTVFNIAVSGYVKVGATQYPITAASASGITSGFSIVGDITKPALFTPCTNGLFLGNYIPNVTVMKDAMNVTGCFTGNLHESELIIGGFFQFDNNVKGTTYRISTSKDNSTDMCCGVNASDVAAFNNNWILFPETMQNYQALAADFTGNNVVSFTDKVQMMRCANGLPPIPEYNAPNWLPWRFARRQGFPPEGLITTFTGNIPDYIDVVNTGQISQLNNGFWGVKRGDLNSDCQACGASVVSEIDSDRSGQQGAVGKEEEIFIEDFSIEEGEIGVIPVYSEFMEGVTDVMLELIVSREDFEVLSIQDGILPEEYPVSGIVEDQNAISVRFGWFTLSSLGVNVPENSVLFYLKVRARKNLPSIKNSIWQIEGTDRNMFKQVNLQGANRFRFRVKAEAPILNSVTLLSSNPIKDSPEVLISIPKQANIEIFLVDDKGEIVESKILTLPKGVSKIVPIAAPTHDGLFTLVIRSEFGLKTIRLIKIQ